MNFRDCPVINRAGNLPMTRVKSMKTVNLLIAACIVTAVSACGGGGAHLRSEVTTVSKGQQLIDLKKAVDDGALTQDEYAKEKAKILGSSE